ncbi:TonB-dependent receptor [Henriciella sp. AS95]|uniref:TonB-dependent receptor domain-containing protein n=1 Tax=Henriciella sp. AS95 TaxID=3135782 RepID=UPI00316F5F61
MGKNARLLGRITSVSVYALCAGGMAFAQDAEPGPETVDDADETRTLETVQVKASTGTLIRGVAPTGTNTISIGEDLIQDIAPASSNDLLANVPQVSNAFNTVPTPGATIANPFNRPNLRNLGASGGSTTLVLLNGQRMVGSGVLQTSPDPSSIAPSVLGNVEVVLDGGSSIYGSDAIGGVINFIPRSEVDGIELSVRQGFGDEFDSTNASVLAGKSWDGGNVYAAYNYNQHDDVFGRDRDYIYQDHTARGGTDYRSVNCSPGTVIANDIPFALPTFTVGANLCDETDVLTVYPEQEDHRFFGKLTQDLSDTLTFEISAYSSDRETVHQGQGPGTGTGVRGQGTITAANPYFQSIFGEQSQTVTFSYADVFGPALESGSELSSWMVTPQLTWDFSETWQLKLSANYGQSDNVVRSNQINALAEAAALAGTTPETALNPYNVSATNPAVLAAIGDFQIYGDSQQELLQLKSVADGTLFSLPSGDVKLAVGAEFIEEKIDAAQGQGPRQALDLFRADSSRDISSVFGEVLFPLFDNEGLGSLDASVSARYDSYSDVGDTTNPKVGFTYKPTSDIAVRGSWGTSFHAPSLADTGNSVDTRIQVVPISPYLAPGAAPTDFLRPTVVVAGGNPDLRPEEAETYSFGVDWVPMDGALQGLLVSLTYFNVEFTDQIAIVPVSEPGFFSTEAYEPFYTVNPTLADALAVGEGLRVENAPSLEALFFATSPYLLVDARRNNLGSVKTDGLDFGVRYQTETDIGGLYAGVWGTYTLGRDVTAAQGAATVDALEFGVSRLQLVADFGWSMGDFEASLRANHSAGYDVSATSDVGSFTTVDLTGRWTLPGNDSWRGDTVLSLGVDNLLDEDPPYFDDIDGYANGSTLGRVVSVGVKQTF